MGRYTITTRTSDVPNAGTDGNVSLSLLGTGATRLTRHLLANSSGKNLFERSQSDVFVVR